MSWTTINLRVATPLFNGGAEAADGDKANGDAGFRISSLRGVMRFWFRALAGLGIGENIPGLAKVENQVFGTTDHASPVKFRLREQPPAATKPGQPTWCQGDDGRWIVYLLGQGLGDLRNVQVTRPYLDAGSQISLQTRLGDDPDIAALVLASLWMTCTYGGLGARTRRGFGGLRIVDVAGDLPAPWTPENLCTPGIDFYQPLHHLWPTGPLNDCMKTLIRVVTGPPCEVPFKPASPNAAPASYPIFSKTHTAAGVSGGEHFNSWVYLLAHAGQQLRHFRATHWEAGARYKPPVKTPEWLEVVHGEETKFGVGALGLPVIYKEGYQVNAFGRQGRESLRRASPLWLRPIGQDREWRLLSFAFQNRFLPPEVRTELRHRSRGPRAVTIPQTEVVRRTNQWIQNLQEDTDLSEP